MCISKAGKPILSLCQARLLTRQYFAERGVGMAMDGVYQRRDVFRRGRGNDAVTEVEDVPRRGARSMKDCVRSTRDRFRVGQERHRVEVALDGDPIADLTAGRTDVHGPVDADAVCTAFREIV